MAVESAWRFNYKEFSHFFAFFHDIVPDGSSLAGSRAREFFLLSNIPPSTLGHIWDLSDVDKDGQLNAAEFSLAINFCQLALDGLQPPSSLPSDVQLLLEQTTNPDKHVAPMKASQLEKCVSVFLSFVENDGGSGYLAGEAARYLLTNSQLPKAVLYHIWKLSDGDKDGRLSFKEFVVAMHLVFIAKLNQPLPISLDPAKILPQEFSAMEKKIAVLVDRKPLCSNRGTERPTVPSFALPINNPCILPVFKEIPAERFLNGKFDNFIGNPFKSSQSVKQELNGGHSSSSQEELSHSNSSRRSSDTSYTESGDISKLSSASQHSSIKSLVEERDKPSLQQVESVELQDASGSTQKTSSSTQESASTQETSASTQKEEALDEDDPVEQEKMEKELEVISKASESYLQKMGGTPPASTAATGDKSSNMQSGSTKDPSSTISIISPEPVVSDKTAVATVTPQSQSEPQNKSQSNPQEKSQSEAQNKSQGIDLSFLDDLEAQVMDVLDETISFDPTKAPPPPPEEPKKKPEPPKCTPPPIAKKSIDETDSVFADSKSKTLPHKRTSLKESPFEIRSRKTSDPEADKSYRRNTISTSPLRRNRPSNSNRASVILDDLDDIFSDELAQIDGLMDARKNKHEERQKRLEDLKDIEQRVPQASTVPMPKLTTMEEVARRRDEESAQQQRQWEKEFEEKARIAYEDQMNEKLQLLSDETIQDLESQFQDLIEHEAHQMKDARIIRAQKLKQKEEEEAERRERMKEEMKGKKEVTIEEWIQMMEENKLKEMSPEDREKYENRKKLWLEERKRKEEERRRIEEEKVQKNREMIAQEYMRQRKIEAEIESARLTKDEVVSLEQEQLKKEAEERKMRSEQARIRKEELKQKEIENEKPKARSSIAARWEQQVKGRPPKDFSSTVMSPTKAAGHREVERLAKRVGNIS